MHVVYSSRYTDTSISVFNLGLTQFQWEITNGCWVSIFLYYYFDTFCKKFIYLVI